MRIHEAPHRAVAQWRQTAQLPAQRSDFRFALELGEIVEINGVPYV
jgi:hypothetical protein